MCGTGWTPSPRTSCVAVAAAATPDLESQRLKAEGSGYEARRRERRQEGAGSSRSSNAGTARSNQRETLSGSDRSHRFTMLGLLTSWQRSTTTAHAIARRPVPVASSGLA